MKKRFLSLTVTLVILVTSVLPLFAQAASGYATRGEVCAQLLNAADDYSPQIVKSDIIKGYGDGELHEQQYITRAECFVMVSRAFGELPMPVGDNLRIIADTPSFTGVPDWAAKDIDNLANAGIIIGTESGDLLANELVTEEHVTTMIQRIFRHLGTNLKDDFYNTVNKDYLDKSQIKPGMSGTGALYDILNSNDECITDIIDTIVGGTHAKGTREQKIAEYYGSVLDMQARNDEGFKPIAGYLDKIDAVSSMQELNAIHTEMTGELCFSGFFDTAIDVNPDDAENYILWFGCYTPSLEKAVYEDASSSYALAYKKYIAALLALVEDSAPSENANAVFEAESALAQVMFNPEDYYDVDKYNNHFSIGELQGMTTEADIQEIIRAAGFAVPDEIIVMDVPLTKAVFEYYKAENLDTLKTMLKVRLIRSFASKLSGSFLDIINEYYENYYGISGEKTEKENAVDATKSCMSDYIGQIYVEKYFSAEAKDDVENMVKDFIDVFKARVQKLDWMSDETKEMAIKKLSTMTYKIGYPDRWPDYMDDVEIKSFKDGGSYFANDVAAAKALRRRNNLRQGGPVDKSEWFMSAFEVNAYYNPFSNEIVFPAGILQGTFYDINAPREANLGATGTVIAHEITHAFDDGGSKYNEKGNAVNWWTQEDHAKFKELCQSVIDAYDGYEVAPGFSINGTQTLSENIADLGGMACALEIMKTLDEPDYKTFFEAYASAWVTSYSREYMEYIGRSDVHACAMARVNKVVSNFDEFYETYGITEKDGMYEPVRVSIW